MRFAACFAALLRFHTPRISAQSIYELKESYLLLLIALSYAFGIRETNS
jgi:hypothetical protein